MNMREKRRRGPRLTDVQRADGGWFTKHSDGSETFAPDEVLIGRWNNIAQFAVCHINKIRPGWIRRYGVPKTLGLRNLARLELS